MVCSRLAAAQSRRGHILQIIAEASETESTVAGQAGIERRFIPRLGWVGAWLGGAARHMLQGLFAEVDLVHLHGVWDPLLVAAGAAARHCGVPYIVVPHGMLDPWSLSQKYWKKRLGLALGGRRLLERAAALHLLNREELDLLQPLGLDVRCSLVPNGVALDEIDPLPGRGEFRTELPGLGQGPYVLFLSRLHFKKGLDILASAFAVLAPEIADLQLIVAGADDGERAGFERRVRDFGLAGRVHLVGPLYGRAKWAALAGCAVYCLPSRQEGFSMAILEALACSRPVVITENCHFPEVAAVGAGVVTPLQAEAVAAGLRQVLNNPIAAARMGAAGRRLVEERFTWDRVAEECDRMYAEAGIRSRCRGGSSSAS